MTYHWYPNTNDCVVKRINVRQEGITTNGESCQVLPTGDKPDFAAERESLLKENPTDRAHVASVNRREVAYYRREYANRDSI